MRCPRGQVDSAQGDRRAEISTLYGFDAVALSAPFRIWRDHGPRLSNPFSVGIFFPPSALRCCRHRRNRSGCCTNQMEIPMISRTLVASALLAGFAFTTPAFAGECPAGQMHADATKAVTTPAKAVTDKVLATIDLSQEKVALN